MMDGFEDSEFISFWEVVMVEGVSVMFIVFDGVVIMGKNGYE